MDPITAFALAVKAMAEMITQLVKDQPPAVSAQMWAYWIEDQARWRKWLHLE